MSFLGFIGCEAIVRFYGARGQLVFLLSSSKLFGCEAITFVVRKDRGSPPTFVGCNFLLLSFQGVNP